MVERELPTKFGLDTCSSFRKSLSLQTDDGCLCHDSSSADKVKQSYKQDVHGPWHCA